MLATATHCEIYLVDIIMPLTGLACRVGKKSGNRKAASGVRPGNTTRSVIQSADLTPLDY